MLGDRYLLIEIEKQLEHKEIGGYFRIFPQSAVSMKRLAHPDSFKSFSESSFSREPVIVEQSGSSKMDNNTCLTKTDYVAAFSLDSCLCNFQWHSCAGS